MYLDAVSQCRHSVSGYLNQSYLYGRIKKKSLWMATAATKLKHVCSLEEMQ